MGQINSVAFNFPPRSWALCDGALLSPGANSALFSLLSSTFGGNGRTTFALPDTRGRSMVGVGQAPGLSFYNWGQRGGYEEVRLVVSQMPVHSHAATFTGTGGGAGGGATASVTVNAITNDANAATTDPTDAYWAAGPTAGQQAGRVFAKGTPNATMAADAVEVTVTGGGGGITGGVVTVANAGGTAPVELLSPYLAVYQVISLEGTYPARN